MGSEYQNFCLLLVLNVFMLTFWKGDQKSLKMCERNIWMDPKGNRVTLYSCARNNTNNLPSPKGDSSTVWEFDYFHFIKLKQWNFHFLCNNGLSIIFFTLTIIQSRQTFKYRKWYLTGNIAWIIWLQEI